MPLRFYLMVLITAIAAAALTVFVATMLMPGEEWVGPAMMTVLAILALAAHLWLRRK